MALKLSTGLRDALLGTDSLKGILDYGVIKIFGGTPPSTADGDDTTFTLLVEITTDGLDVTPGATTNGLVFAAPSGGTIAKSADNWSGAAVATGTASWFRLYDNDVNMGSSSTAARLQGTVGTYGADMLVSSTNVVGGATITVDSFNMTLPAK